MKKLTAKQIANMIEKRVSYFNGWSVPLETMKEDCLDAANAILKAMSEQRLRDAGWVKKR